MNCYSILSPNYKKFSNPQQTEAWIGANTTILQGVTIGENATVVAGAVVSKNIPDNTVVGGIPMKVINDISSTGN